MMKMICLLAFSCCLLCATEFKEYKGRIYDGPFLKSDGWESFENAVVIEVVGDHELLLRAEIAGESKRILLKNFPKTSDLIDGSWVSFTAQYAGIYEYITVQGARSRIPKYDHGHFVVNEETREAERRLKRVEKEIDDANEAAAKAVLRQQEAKKAAWRALDDERRQEKAAEKNAKLLKFQIQQASNGLPAFQYELGLRYLNGDGVERDQVAGRRWLKAAADQGHDQAKEKLKGLP